MKTGSRQIYPLGTDAVTVEFGNEISAALNEQAVSLSEYFERNPFAGFIETVPAYASVTIFFDVAEVRRSFPASPTAFEAVSRLIDEALLIQSTSTHTETRLVEIPVDFSAEFALDLDFIASENRLTPERVIELFTARTYRVFMLGFLPGFAYMGEVERSIATPRKLTPRLIVPKGSVGIAGKQTGIYPTASPGGWQIVGKTDFELFTPRSNAPCALKPGDRVKFYRI